MDITVITDHVDVRWRVLCKFVYKIYEERLVAISCRFHSLVTKLMVVIM